MSLEFKDLRTKVTARTNAVLEALNRATGKDKSELAREVLDRWAEEQVHAASLIDRMLRAEGEPGIVGGTPGSAGGTPGSGRGIVGNRGECQG